MAARHRLTRELRPQIAIAHWVLYADDAGLVADPVSTGASEKYGVHETPYILPTVTAVLSSQDDDRSKMATSGVISPCQPNWPRCSNQGHPGTRTADRRCGRGRLPLPVTAGASIGDWTSAARASPDSKHWRNCAAIALLYTQRLP